MPEGIEIEIYRRAAEATVGRTVTAIDVPEPAYLRNGMSPEQLEAAISGARIEVADRIGKLLLLELASGSDRPTLGLRFGMTGRLVVDGDAPIDELLYSTTRPDPAYTRFVMRFEEGGELVMIDPRRLGSVELAPDTTVLGPDAFSITPDELADSLRGGRGPLKARLLDQARIAGIGNLIADETLWRAGISPERVAGSLSEPELAHLAEHIRGTTAHLAERGGSHTGDLQDQRHPDGVCPLDGAPLVRSTVGGRTTYWCPQHQR